MDMQKWREINEFRGIGWNIRLLNPRYLKALNTVNEIFNLNYKHKLIVIFFPVILFTGYMSDIEL